MIHLRLASIGQMLLVRGINERGKPVVSEESIHRGMKSLGSSAKKLKHLERVRSFFFFDSGCKVFHQALLDELEKELSTGTTAAANTNGSAHASNQAAAATTSNGRKRPPPTSGFPAPHFPPPSFAFPPGFMQHPNFMTNGYGAQFSPSFHPSVNTANRFEDSMARLSGFYAAQQNNGSIAARSLNATTTATSGLPTPNSVARLSSQATQQQDASSMPNPFDMSFSATRNAPTNAPNSAEGSAAAPAASPSSLAANSSSSNNDGSLPRTPLEIKLLMELQQMGFQDRSEVLNAIRHFTEKTNGNSNSGNDSGSAGATDNGGPVTSDEVMMWIITQREELEEAKKMDLARLQSEALRKEQAERRKQEKENRLESASLDDLGQAIFPNSWVLKLMKSAARSDNGDRNCGSVYSLVEQAIQQTLKDNNGGNAECSTALKNILIELLQYEQDARKWYNCLMPRAYFEKWCQELMDRYDCHPESHSFTASSDSPPSCLLSWMKTQLESEVKHLQSAMFSLSEQKGGVPIIFIKAHDEACKKNGGYSNGKSDDDDDVIIID